MWTREGGGGVSEKTMFVHMGGGRVRGLSTWTKTFFGDQFFVHEFKKGCENFKKKIVYV